MLKAIIEYCLWRPCSIVFHKLLARNGRHILLNVGCGPHVFDPPWVNTDLHINSKLPVYMNLQRKLPYASSSIEIVFAEHVVEHLSKNHQTSFFKECHRVLCNKGALVLVVPHVDPLATLRLNEKPHHILAEYQKFDASIKTTSDLVDSLMRGHGHRFLWFKSDLLDHLSSLGYVVEAFNKLPNRINGSLS